MREIVDTTTTMGSSCKSCLGGKNSLTHSSCWKTIGAFAGTGLVDWMVVSCNGGADMTAKIWFDIRIGY